MRETLPIGTKVKIIGLHWGEATKPLYNIPELIGQEGEVIDHDNDAYTPPNVVQVNGYEKAYFMPNECLEVLK